MGNGGVVRNFSGDLRTTGGDTSSSVVRRRDTDFLLAVDVVEEVESVYNDEVSQRQFRYLSTATTWLRGVFRARLEGIIFREVGAFLHSKGEEE